MAFHNVHFPKIHDLMPLLDLAFPLMAGLDAFREEFAEITNYSVAVRYPDDLFEPSRDDAEHSLSVAEGVVLLVRNAIEQNTTA